MTGSLDSHQAVCGFLVAEHAASGCWRSATGSRRNIPFPAAVDDAVDGLTDSPANTQSNWAPIRHRSRWAGTVPAPIWRRRQPSWPRRSADPIPAFLLLFYPPCDAVNRAPSRELFASGFLLTDADIVWFCDHYLPPTVDRGDPRASILLAGDLTGMPPTYLVTAGFDPIRDEGEMYARRLAEAGVPVVLRRQPALVHGFVNMIGLSPALPAGGRRGRRGVADRTGRGAAKCHRCVTAHWSLCR